MGYRYQIVPTAGRYGSGELVRPVRRTNKSLSEAQSMAVAMTRAFRARMRPYGGTGGGYRVIDGDKVWSYGHDLDHIPTA